MSNGSEHIPEYADLDGATTPNPEGSYPSSAGEFAASWNSWTPERREDWLQRRVQSSQTAMACFSGDHEGTIAELHRQNRGIAERAWDEGFTACAHEHMRQRDDPSHPITRVNPYAEAEEWWHRY